MESINSIFIIWLAGKPTLVSYVFNKNQIVLILSTMHNEANIDVTNGDKNKPEVIIFENITKSGIDTVDQPCSSCMFPEKPIEG